MVRIKKMEKKRLIQVSGKIIKALEDRKLVEEESWNSVLERYLLDKKEADEGK